MTADSDPYTIGQVASGLTHGGVVTGVDYSNGVVSGVGAIGNRAYAGHVGYAGVGHLGYANHVVAAPAAYSGVVAAPSVYSSVVPTTSIHGYCSAWSKLKLRLRTLNSVSKPPPSTTHHPPPPTKNF